MSQSSRICPSEWCAQLSPKSPNLHSEALFFLEQFFFRESTLWRNNNYTICQKHAVLYYCIHWYVTSLLFCLFISLATPRSTDCWAKSRPGHRSSSALEAGFVEVAAVGCPLLVGPSGFIQRSTDGRGAKVKQSEVSAIRQPLARFWGANPTRSATRGGANRDKQTGSGSAWSVWFKVGNGQNPFWSGVEWICSYTWHV